MASIRKDWSSLSPTERAWYATAVGEMKKITQKDPNDPRGWQYQANVHGVSGGVPPALKNFWAQCQHQSYFFLSWHRMYIYYFEEILRAVTSTPGATLPYWNYTDTPDVASTRALPEEFWKVTTNNPLYVERRNPLINRGGSVPKSDVLYEGAYQYTDFYSAGTTVAGGVALALAFGGYPTGPVHFSTYNGQLENQPHNLVHVKVGGLMGNPNTAAADPIFWLHHSNIDRLWEGWLAQGGGRHNPLPGESPASDHWLTSTFQFHDGQGNQVQLTGAQVVDTAQQLGYVYDKLPPTPLTRRTTIAPHAFLAKAAVTGTAGVAADTAAAPAELGGAEETGLQLDNVKTVELPLAHAAAPKAGPRRVSAPAADTAEVAPAPETQPRVVLSLEGLHVEGQPELTYEVYLDAPDLRHATPESIYYVGNIGIFTHGDDEGGNGEHDAHAGHAHHGGHAGDGGGGDDPHAGHGLTNIGFDITDVVNNLQAQNEWDPGNPKVTFVARGVEPPEQAATRSRLSAAERSLADELPAADKPVHYTVQRIRVFQV